MPKSDQLRREKEKKKFIGKLGTKIPIFLYFDSHYWSVFKLWVTFLPNIKMFPALAFKILEYSWLLFKIQNREL
jgi:hypothetical protein